MLHASTNEVAEPFAATQADWDLERLYAELTTAKRQDKNRDLTVLEKVCLRGLLSGHRPSEIAQVLHREPKGLQVDLVRGLYSYIETLLGQRPRNWREIASLLGNAGYRCAGNRLSIAIRLDQDWGDALSPVHFLDRAHALLQLEQWITHDHCRLISILGMGGIGKTALAVRLAEHLTRSDITHLTPFQAIIWRSLRNAPPPEMILKDWLEFLAPSPSHPWPDTFDGLIGCLLQYLRSSRCLLVLDNVETILQAGDTFGAYRLGYAGYGQILRAIADTQHQSCLIITSREKPGGLAQREGHHFPVRSLIIPGLSVTAGQQLFQAIGQFQGSDYDWHQLIQQYGGNPLVLKQVAATIAHVFGGNLPQFLSYHHQTACLLPDIYHLLDQQFERLSEPEHQLMTWLAQHSQPVTLADIQTACLVDGCPQKFTDWLEALTSLQRRSLCFTVPAIGPTTHGDFISSNACPQFAQSPMVQQFVRHHLSHLPTHDSSPTP